MTIDVSLFVILVGLVLFYTVLNVILWIGMRSSSKTIASMSDVIAAAGRDNAHLRGEKNRLEAENVLLNAARTTAEHLATALGDATRTEAARHQAMLVSGAGIFAILGGALAFHQVEPERVTEILMDLEVGEQAFIAAFLGSYFGWPGEPIEPEDYTEEQAARADVIRNALGVLK